MPQKHENAKPHKNNFLPLEEKLEIIGKKIVDSAYCVHKNLGPGLLETYQRQIDIPISYDGLVFDQGLRLDVLVEDAIVCELKAVDELNPVWEAQILSHMKLTGKRLGYLINFNVINIGSGIKRFII